MQPSGRDSEAWDPIPLVVETQLQAASTHSSNPHEPNNPGQYGDPPNSGYPATRTLLLWWLEPATQETLGYSGGVGPSSALGGNASDTSWARCQQPRRHNQ